MLRHPWLCQQMPPAARAWQELRLQEAAMPSPSTSPARHALREQITSMLAVIRSRDSSSD
jgi:hypothetical protein